MGLPTPLARVLDAMQGDVRRPRAPGPRGPVAVGAAARAHRGGRAAGLVVRQVRRQARDDGDQPPRVLPAARRGRGVPRRRLRRLRRRHRRRLQRDVRHRARACPARPTARSRPGPRVRRPRRPGRPAGVRRRRGVPGRVGAAVRTAAQRGAAHGRDPRQGGRPPAGDGAARQPRLVRRAGLLPPQLLRVLGAARRAVGRGAHRGAPEPDQRDDVGGWGAFQSRSYFAVQLSPRWWLWAVDSQLDAPIDAEQLSYFRAARLHLGDAKVILCTATPSWLEAERAGTETYSAEADSPLYTLLWFIDRVLGPRRAPPDPARADR